MGGQAQLIERTDRRPRAWIPSRASPHPEVMGGRFAFGGSGRWMRPWSTVSIGCMNRLKRLVGLLAARLTEDRYDPNA